MRPDERELDDEIRGHLALSIQERIERGEDPAAARLAALRELGYIPAVRDSMRRVWVGQWLETADAFLQDVRVGLRSLRRAKGLAATVVVTLALGVGANAAIFSVVRGVLLRPLVNRGEDALLYIRQSAPGLADENTTFSVPEIGDFKSRVTTVAAFGDFSTVRFTLLGLGEPRVVRAGVVGGSYFEVMGLQPVHGRLLTPADDGPDAAPVAVLTNRFWASELESDPKVVGKTIRLSSREAMVVGVLEPSLPYPEQTEIIANVVTSPHHLEATMVTGRTHRMTELFGRLAPGATPEDARTELASVHAAMVREHPGAYPANAGVRLSVTPLRDQITSPARTILVALLAAAGVVFVIACLNVVNLILTRSVRREGELAVRAALGASRAALRRTLLAESLVLCGAGAALGVLLARPLVAVVAGFASRYTVRALEVTVDASLLWVGAGLAIAAAVLLAYIPKLSAFAPPGLRPSRGSTEPGLTAGSIRITPTTNRRLRIFAITQVACSFLLLAAAGALLATVVALHHASTGYDMRNVLALDVPAASVGISDTKEMALQREMTRRIDELPGVDGVALGSTVPWRDAGHLPSFPFAVEGRPLKDGDPIPHARLRIVAPRFFRVVGVPLIAGREFTGEDRTGSERVAIVSRSLAERQFADGDAIGRTVWWTDPMFTPIQPRRVVGIVEDVDDENVLPGPALTIYLPVQQLQVAGRLFVHTTGDPKALVPQVTQVIRELSADQPVEHPATLGQIRAKILEPQRLNAFVLSGFAGVALLVAVVGVAGVLAFSVSARTREFGVRMALGSSRSHLLARVLSEGVVIVVTGILAGVAAGVILSGIVARYVDAVRLPDPLAMAVAAIILIGAAIVAAVMPALRASRVDVLQALWSE